jgi:hypothetical protein
MIITIQEIILLPDCITKTEELYSLDRLIEDGGVIWRYELCQENQWPGTS